MDITLDLTPDVTPEITEPTNGTAPPETTRDTPGEDAHGVGPVGAPGGGPGTALESLITVLAIALVGVVSAAVHAAAV